MSEVIAAASALVVIGTSLFVYFKFIDKPLDKALDRVFAGWHKDLEEIEEQ